MHRSASRSRAGLSLRALLASALAAALACAGCKSGPTAKDRNTAADQVQVAAALMNEAEALGREGKTIPRNAKYRATLEQLMEAEKRDPTNADVQHLLAITYFVGFRRKAEAEKHARAAISLRAEQEEKFPEAENLLGTILVDQGRAAEAIPFFESARTNLLYRTPFFAEQEIGWAKHLLGQDDAAAVHLRAAIEMQPDLCGAYTRLAQVETARGDDAAAVKVLDDFVTHCDVEPLRDSIDPSLIAFAYFRLGMARMKIGAAQAAADALNECQTRFPKEAVAQECKKTLQRLQ